MTIMTFVRDTNAACDLDGYEPGSHFPAATAVDGRLPSGNTRFPLDSEGAEDLMDRDGNITVTLLLDQEEYFTHFVSSAQGDHLTPEDYAHSVAFGFGRPRECFARVMGTHGSGFVVDYSTHIAEFLEV